MPANAMAWSDFSEFLLLSSDMISGNLLHSDGNEESTHILLAIALQNSFEKLESMSALESFEREWMFRMNIHDLELLHSSGILPSTRDSSENLVDTCERGAGNKEPNPPWPDDYDLRRRSGSLRLERCLARLNECECIVEGVYGSSR